MRTAFLDPFSGASGDMLLGAMVDAGLPLDSLQARLQPLGLEGYRLTAKSINQHGISGT